jgi:hypothetical protein
MKFSSLLPALLVATAGTLGAHAASVEFVPVREADLFAATSAAETIIALTPAAVSHEVILDDAKAQPEAAPAKPADPDSFFKGWKGSIEGGLNGSNGNSDNLSFRLGLGASRETSAMKTTAALTYTYATSDGEKTKSRGVFDLRNDWNLGERTIFFATGKLEYDEFQDWDWRLSAFTGPGYYFVKSDRTKLLGRVGVGVTKEVGGSTNELIPEGLIGADLEHKITERQKCFVTVEYIPSISEAWDYRVNAKAGWEVLVDPEVNMTLKIGIDDRYDHNPGPGFKKNDIEYFILLAWNF